ncbi:MAG: hypothetical protein H7235_05240, partial [Bdellovibrionaceae bacterium]|nr:hypothetical protein [Pseudobdellovibrionaceae bacterium]
MKNIIFWVALFTTLSATADIPTGVFTGITQFTSQNQRLPLDYVKQIPQTIHNLLISFEKQFNQQNSQACINLTNVQYIKEFQPSNNAIINDFESSFLRIEVARCFDNTTAAKVLSTMNSLE